MIRKYSINDCEKLIDRLYNSSNLSTKERSKKRDELKNIGVNLGKKNYNHQTLEDFFISNSIWSIEELENTGFFLEDIKTTDKIMEQKDIKSSDEIIKIIKRQNTHLARISNNILFFFWFFIISIFLSIVLTIFGASTFV